MGSAVTATLAMQRLRIHGQQMASAEHDIRHQVDFLDIAGRNVSRPGVERFVPPTDV